MCELSPVTKSSDHFSSSSRSSGSTPSMSPMTAIGNGAAMSRTKSHSPRSQTSSIRVSQSRSIEGTLSITRLRVNPALTSLRRNRCAGSSMSIMNGMPGVFRPDAAGVREQLRVALGIEHRLIRRGGGQTVAVTEHRLVRAHPRIGRTGTAVGVEVAVGQVDVEPGLGQYRSHSGLSTKSLVRQQNVMSTFCRRARDECAFGQAQRREFLCIRVITESQPHTAWPVAAHR